MSLWRGWRLTFKLADEANSKTALRRSSKLPIRQGRLPHRILAEDVRRPKPWTCGVKAAEHGLCFGSVDSNCSLGSGKSIEPIRALLCQCARKQGSFALVEVGDLRGSTAPASPHRRAAEESQKGSREQLETSPTPVAAV